MREQSSPHRHCSLPASLDRRAFLVMLAAGTVAVLDACSNDRPGVVESDPPPASADLPASPGVSAPPSGPVPPLPPIPARHPGRAHLVNHAASPTPQIALTIDDGYCGECVAGYVTFAEHTGIPITFSPNGTFRQLWEPHTDRLRPLIARGQVQIANHTWSHPDLTKLHDSKIRDELDRNGDWIEHTYGITARPWFRPPFGKRNHSTDAIAASLGYTNILLWNGTFGDSTEISPDQLLANADQYLKAGNIVLGHANHPTVLQLFDRIQQLLHDRNLQPVTLDTMFNTSRAQG